MDTASEKFGLLVCREKLLSHKRLGSKLIQQKMQWRKDFAKLEEGISSLNRNFFSMIVSMMTGVLTLTYFDTLARVISLLLPHSIPDAYTLIVQFLNSDNLFFL